MIEPTIGRKVWFRPNGHEFPALSVFSDQPLDATVVYVHGPRMVNLAVFDHAGLFFIVNSVPLQQGDDPVPAGFYAEWMPFQKGQAANAEAPKEKLAEGGTDPHPRITEEAQMINSAVWAAKDILGVARIGSDLYRKAESTADLVLERIRQLMGGSVPLMAGTQAIANSEALGIAARAFGDVALQEAPSVTPEQIEGVIVSGQYHVLPGTTITICCLTLRNGFTVIGESACASPENFDEARGRKYARENAVSKIWKLEGYLLKQRLYDLHQQPPAAPDMGDTCSSDCSSNNRGCPELLGPCDCQPGSRVERIARLAHEVNRAYCSSLGDDSQLAWEDAPEWQRSSAIAGVHAHMQSELTHEQSHESWMAQKAADGWTYGPVKDAEKKEHPCFLPYADLPTSQRTKDYLFRAVVTASK